MLRLQDEISDSTHEATTWRMKKRWKQKSLTFKKILKCKWRRRKKEEGRRKKKKKEDDEWLKKTLMSEAVDK